MSTKQSNKHKPGSSRDHDRLLGTRVMISALKFQDLCQSDLLDCDEKLAAVIGEAQHARLRKQFEDENGELDIFGQRGPAPHKVRLLAAQYLGKVESKLIKKTRGQSDDLSLNVSKLARIIGLNRTEAKVLEFVVRLDSNRSLKEVAEAFDGVNHFTLVKSLARVTGSQHDRVRAALSEDSLLAQSGLLEFDMPRRGHSRRMLSGGMDDICLLPGLAHALLCAAFDFDKVFAPFFKRSAASGLDLSNYEYLQDEVTVVHALLKGALRKSETGIQVLLYGPPGTGKTELALALAESIGAPLYSVATGTSQGTPYDRDERFRSYKLAQRALQSRKKALLLFDEVEDVFPDSLGLSMTANRQKGWTNELLETSRVPSIWITNSTGCMDDAYLRRFSLVLEIGRPPKRVRKAISEHYLADYAVSESMLSRIAGAVNVTPADLSRTRRVLSIGDDLGKDAESVENAVRTLLGSGPNGSNSSALSSKSTFALPPFDPALINTDVNLQALIEGLGRSGEGRLCLYGQPGTGKTAFAAYVAQRLDRELITVSASSWLNCYLGETEKNMRASFDQAERSNAVLFVDEADSFLRDRSTATKSWETTQVNELLKRLEEARGVVMFATNDFAALDTAVLRRLDIKAEFRALDKAQVVTLFERTLLANDSADNEKAFTAEDKRVDALEGLVAGDFAAASRCLQVSGCAVSAENLYSALAKELKIRTAHRGNSIGFAAQLH